MELILIYRPRRDGRLSWPSWLTHSGRLTHEVVTRQPWIRRRSGSVRQLQTDVLTTEPRRQMTIEYILTKMTIDMKYFTCLLSYTAYTVQPMRTACHSAWWSPGRTYGTATDDGKMPERKSRHALDFLHTRSCILRETKVTCDKSTKHTWRPLTFSIREKTLSSSSSNRSITLSCFTA